MASRGGKTRISSAPGGPIDRRDRPHYDGYCGLSDGRSAQGAVRLPLQRYDMSKPRVPISAAGPERFDTATFFATVAQGRQTVTYLRDTTIFAQGDPAEAVFFITKGRIKVTVVSRQGKEAVIAILAPDEFLGERCLIGRPTRLATAAAITDCVLMRVDKVEIQRLLEKELAFSHMFISHILLRSARIEEDLVDQLFNSTEKRLARVLLLLANFGKEGRPEPIIANISQETLAEMDARGDDRHDPREGEPFHEPFQAAGFHRLQRPD